MNSFEGSFLGRDERVDAGTVLECGVCWWVYDPAQGDSVWQIPPGTPFTQLPSHWRCPRCDAARHQFMVIQTGGEADDAAEADAEVKQKRADTAAQLREAYESVAARMRGLPVYRDDLPLDVLGPRACDEGLIALVYSPWCMNLVLLAEDAEARVEGSEREVSFPSGDYGFIRGRLPGVGAVENCSLFSPMEAFSDADSVEAVAREVLDALFTPADAAADTQRSRSENIDTSRRRFLGGSSEARAQS